MAGHERKLDHAKSGAAQTRAIAKQRKAELAANPIDWGRQIDSIRRFMDMLDQQDRVAASAAAAARRRRAG